MFPRWKPPGAPDLSSATALSRSRRRYSSPCAVKNRGFLKQTVSNPTGILNIYEYIFVYCWYYCVMKRFGDDRSFIRNIFTNCLEMLTSVNNPFQLIPVADYKTESQIIIIIIIIVIIIIYIYTCYIPIHIGIYLYLSLSIYVFTYVYSYLHVCVCLYLNTYDSYYDAISMSPLQAEFSQRSFASALGEWAPTGDRERDRDPVRLGAALEKCPPSHIKHRRNHGKNHGKN